MFHFEGSWVDLVYTSFFLLGLMWTGLIALIAFIGIATAIVNKQKAKKERIDVMNMLDPELRKKKIESLISDAGQKLQDIEDANKTTKTTKTTTKKEKNVAKK